jgi:hypothetical protein
MGEKQILDLILGLATGGFGIALLIVFLLWVILWLLVPFYIYAINRNIKSQLNRINNTLVNILVAVSKSDQGTAAGEQVTPEDKK